MRIAPNVPASRNFELLMTELRNRGVDYPPFFDLRILRTLVYSVGSPATVAFLFFSSDSGKTGSPAGESGARKNRPAG